MCGIEKLLVFKFLYMRSKIEIIHYFCKNIAKKLRMLSFSKSTHNENHSKEHKQGIFNGICKDCRIFRDGFW